MANPTKNSFEDDLTALENIVEQLESGELSLDDAMKAFESGVKLTNQCQKTLADAQQKVQVLVDKNGLESLQDLDDQEA
ncbi:exodeoxyribonuclease VII small subunit [Reinekea marina]|uniref:Exodeoxyribonuclease 7 small subunit n=1 Tax=Reinekea marina TaxID=1310421 RepID=A0ABV7WQE0_9GAMM|nr:exodeoxyribonuclease VII small subunit [Reinekea marina]MBU2863510.1 exodeoxyribonuclease VII small subunit [Reinekea forsetii]MDN3650602.1 exodeoxyribonuclease VII small subunit [Reinekea marina]